MKQEKKAVKRTKEEYDWTNPESIRYKNMDDWREKDEDPYSTLLRNSHQLLFIDKYCDLKKPAKILDYGCAYGDLLVMIKMLNPKHDIYGLEYIDNVAKNAEIRIGKNHVFNQSCSEKIPLRPDSFDVICSFDMIEHIPLKSDVDLFLKECNRMLKKGGIFIITTPNCSALMRIIYKITGNRYIVDPKVHPNAYNIRRLKKEVGSRMKIIDSTRGYDLSPITRILSWFGAYKHICIVATKK
jgi:2-polyprenyl-3-methyl-5-hydroxy-6-metoxy-1,4-benzoquinol methylase